MNGPVIANFLARAAIGAVIANGEDSIIIHLDGRDRARLHAIGNLPAFSLINCVHTNSFIGQGMCFPAG